MYASRIQTSQTDTRSHNATKTRGTDTHQTEPSERIVEDNRIMRAIRVLPWVVHGVVRGASQSGLRYSELRKELIVSKRVFKDRVQKHESKEQRRRGGREMGMS
jgi:hypothetical protein